MRGFRSIYARLRGEQRGQAILVFALMFVVLLGFTAMVSDVGIAYWNRRILQNAVDGAALAGARKMLPPNPDPVAALAAATAYANQNGVATSELIPVTDPQYGPQYGLQVTTVIVNGKAYPLVIVSARRQYNFGLRYMVEAGDSTIVATASAIVAPMNPQPGDLLPFGVLKTASCLPVPNPTDGTVGCEIKTDSKGNVNGNFGPVTYPNNPQCNGNGNGNSANCYEITIGNGYSGSPPLNNPLSWFSTNPGNMPNGSTNGVAALFAEDQNKQCDGTFTLSGNTLNLTSPGPDCSNTTPPHYVTPPASLGGQPIADPVKVFNPVTRDGTVCYQFTDCPRVGIIPVIDATTWPNGSSTNVTITGYQCFYIAGYTSGGGNEQNVYGFFVNPTDPNACSVAPRGGSTLNFDFNTGQVGVALWH